MVLTVSGCNLEESVFNTITSLSNMGPGYGSTGPASTFAGLSVAAKWVMSFMMLLGRLEIYTVLLIFMPAFWNKR